MMTNHVCRQEAVEVMSAIEAVIEEHSAALPEAMRRHVRTVLRHAQDEIEQGRGTDAVVEARAVAELTRMPAAYLLLAWVLLQSRQPLSALAALFDLEQLQVEVAEMHMLKGLIFYALNRRAEARTALQLAVQRKPNLLQAWRLLIKMVVEAENSNAAFLVFMQALQHSTRHPKLLSLQACLRHQPGAPCVVEQIRGTATQSPVAMPSAPEQVLVPA